MHAYPLTFEPMLKEKVWGGRRLSRYAKALPGGAMVGESWEIADLAGTDPEGGGGGEARSVVRSGPMRGWTIGRCAAELGADLMGCCSMDERGGFPLLVKLLDAQENLSVQVHPSPAYAAAHEGAHLKTESWYVIEAEPGACIYKGLRPEITPGLLGELIERGEADRALVRMEVRPGDFHHLPSGTCHALGAGVLVAEVQTPSDTTFRVFDWGRTGRALHVAQARACIHFGGADATGPVRGTGPGRHPLERNEYYEVAELRGDAGDGFALSGDDLAPRVLMCIAGRVRLVCESSAWEPVSLVPGQTVLLPAALAEGAVVLEEPGVLLETRLVAARR